MLICNPYEIIIQGITQNGKKFRPSDWSDRLGGVLSSFDEGHRLSYHQWVRPILVDNIRCVAVDRKLEQINEAMFQFLMDFAHDNNLRVTDCKALLEEQGDKAELSLEDAIQLQEQEATAKQDIATQEANHQAQANFAAVQTNTSLRELAPEESMLAFAVLQRLRPNIRDMQQFQELTDIQRKEGYRLIGIFEENKQNPVAACGFRISNNFASGKYLHIDDLVTKDDATGKGYASQLIEKIITIAKEEKCSSIHADSRVDLARSNAHRLYLKHNFVISCHHFSYYLDPNVSHI